MKMKSNQRVKKYGEIFTPRRIVDLMLDQPEIKSKVDDLTATFLEPSAGEGAFLTEILKRKMKVAWKQSSTVKEFDQNSLLGLSTLYGIELLEDNVTMLVINMYSEFVKDYQAGVTQFKSEINNKVLKSAKVIIQANMVQGNTLEGTKNDGSPIMLSKWKVLPATDGMPIVQRSEQTFNSILNANNE